MRKLLIIFISIFITFSCDSQILGVSSKENTYVASTPLPIGGVPVLVDTTYVIAIMGQSNIDGRAAIAGLPADIANPTSQVKYYNNSSWNDVDIANYPMSDIPNNLGFAHDAIWLQRLSDSLNETIYIVKKSQGGTTFKQTTAVKGDWNVNSGEEQDHYIKFMRRLQSTKNYVEQVEGKNFKLMCLVVDIFESDSVESDSITLTTDFKDFINAVRTFANNPNLPIIHRELSINQTIVNQWTIDLQNFFANNTEAQGGIDNYYLIDGSGTTFFDGTHLDAASNELISDRILPLLLQIYRNQL